MHEPTKNVELSVLTEDGDIKEPAPVVFIEGWAAGTSAKIFSGLDTLINEGRQDGSQDRRLLVIKCGCYSSLWDRAHEIYYALKGGTCDYGVEHAGEHGHAQFGRVHKQGIYENWSEEYPLHFVGHSFGGATIFHLQQLIQKGVLPGSPGMLKSITTISSPLRGTPLASSLGQLDGPAAGQKRFSLGWMMAVGVHVANTANIVASDLYDFGGDQWLPDAKQEDDETRSRYGIVDSFCDYIGAKSMGFSADSAGYDMLPAQMQRHNSEAVLCSETFYRSYTASTKIPLYLPPLAFCHYLVSTHAQTHLNSDVEWRENDGFIPVKSQAHPGDCQETVCLHVPDTVTPDQEPPPLSGVWHVKHYDNTTHFGLVDYLWKLRTSSKTRTFWSDFGEWLRRVDDAAQTSSTENVKHEFVTIAEA